MLRLTVFCVLFLSYFAFAAIAQTTNMDNPEGNGLAQKLQASQYLTP